jgi:hypothetical protein
VIPKDAFIRTGEENPEKILVNKVDYESSFQVIAALQTELSSAKQTISEMQDHRNTQAEIITRTRAELEAVKGELRKYKEGFKNEQHKFGMEFLKNEKLTSKLKTATEALEFYADENKWFRKDITINFQETTAVFKVEDPSKLPTDFKTTTPECSARLKVDAGNKARTALASIKEA